MNCNILMVNPWIYDFAAYDLWYKPYGLLSLASILRMNGANIFFIDCLDPPHDSLKKESGVRKPRQKPSGKGSYAREEIPKPPLLNVIKRKFYRFGMSPGIFLSILKKMPPPDLILITSMMTYWYLGLFETISILKTFFPGIPIIIGGNYVTLCPQHASESGADFCIAGPGELSLPLLIKSILKIDMERLPDFKNLDSYPYPAFDLINQCHHAPILTSRGCLFHCSYCASSLLNHEFRRRDPIRVADEICHWHSFLGIRHFSFYDDALLVDQHDFAVPLLKEIIRRQLPLHFHCPNGLHLREITPEISALMFKSGFKTIRFGFETSNQLRQIQTGAKVDNKDLSNAIKHLKGAGYQTEDIGIYLLCGLPGQPADEINESIHLVKSYGARPMLAEYSPIPGTKLWNEAVSCSSYPIKCEPLFHNNTLLPCRSPSLTYDAYQRLKLTSRI